MFRAVQEDVRVLLALPTSPQVANRSTKGSMPRRSRARTTPSRLEAVATATGMRFSWSSSKNSLAWGFSPTRAR